MICRRINIYGEVYQTGLRYFLKDKAANLNISGRTFYLSDNSLYIIALGEVDNMKTFINFCETGNQYSLIKKIKVSNQVIFNFTSFEIVDEKKVNTI